MKKPDNSIFLIFGASGDLTKRKLIPALFQLYRQGLFCNDFAVLGISRTKYDDKSFRESMSNSINEYSENKKIKKKLLNNFVQNIFYTPINTEDADEYSLLKSRIEEIGRGKKIKNIIYYLSTPPKLYEIILKGIKKQKLHLVNDEKEKKKIVIEKPFGYDLRSAKKLNDLLHTMFDESQIYRIDHYLGKETVQNILALRFSNGIYEPLWNRNYIDHVEITSAESIGVENRGGYYEGIGAMRDMVQNHMLQVASFIAMEPPSSFDADLVRNETFKVFQSLRRINKDEAANFSVRGQYLVSTIKGKKLLGYREEENVNEDSRTETFAALKFYVDNWRWGGVPFYIRAGKRLPTKVTEVVIHFKKTPHPLFAKDNAEQISNMLVIRIQPDEGILLKFGLKTPGSGFKIQSVNMDFHYTDIAAEEIPTAYERLLLDCLLGDSTLFTRADAIEECWKFIDPIIEAWKEDGVIKMYGYPSGTWGPKESFDLFDDPDVEWRYPCRNLTDDGVYCEL
jgi:glucose-6-phosphate 1-dehydrogenase